MPVLRALQGDQQAKCVVCVSGQHEDLLKPLLSLFAIRPHYRLRVMSSDQSLSSLTATLLKEIEPVISKERPDWTLVQGDTTSAMAASLASWYQRVRVAHIEAGIRSRNNQEPFPEEINRRIVDLTADLHFAPTALEEKELIREGVSPASIHVTGNTCIDTLRYISSLPFLVRGSVLEHLPLGSKRIILVTVHRRENQGEPLGEICSAIRDVAQHYRDTIHVVLPVHPNPNVNLPVHKYLSGIENVSLLPPLDYQDLIALAKASFFAMTDSGGLQEELPWLGKPILVLRNVTERREGVLVGGARLVGTRRADIVAAAIQLMEDHQMYERMAQFRTLYGDGMAGPRIAQILRSRAASEPKLRSLVNTTPDLVRRLPRPAVAI